MVVTHDEALADRCRLLRNQAHGTPRFEHQMQGYNYRLTNLQAAIGLAQCEQADQKVERRRAIAERYSGLLKGVEAITGPVEEPWAKNTYWMYSILINDSFGLSRDAVMTQLKSRGIDSRSFFHPMHLQPVFKGRDAGAYPVATDIGARGLYLPSGLGLSDEQQERVVKTLLSLRK